MTEEHIKEKLSNNFVGILAAYKGYTIDKPDLDYGADYFVSRTIVYVQPNGKNRFLKDSKYIALQLKCTTENGVIETDTHIKYDLEVKNYNDLVEYNTGGIAPLILILVILPRNKVEWVDVDDLSIKLKRWAFWFQPPVGSTKTTNEETIRISIPKENKLSIDCFDQLFARHY